MFSDKQNLRESVVRGPALYLKGNLSGRKNTSYENMNLHKEIKSTKYSKYGKHFRKDINKRQKYKSHF